MRRMCKLNLEIEHDRFFRKLGFALPLRSKILVSDGLETEFMGHREIPVKPFGVQRHRRGLKIAFTCAMTHGDGDVHMMMSFRRC